VKVFIHRSVAKFEGLLTAKFFDYNGHQRALAILFIFDEFAHAFNLLLANGFLLKKVSLVQRFFTNSESPGPCDRDQTVK